MSGATLTLHPRGSPGGSAGGGWIVSRPYDLFWFFGGALLALAALGLHFGLGASILLLWWVWLLAFDGPHIAAAFTRTYVDLEEWRSRARVLVTSLLTFAIGPVALVLNLVTGREEPFFLFLAVGTFYAYYHIVRQHYGFLALYKAKGGERSALDFRLDKWALYVGLWAPYAYFVLTHEKARALVGVPREGALDLVARVGATLAAAAFFAAAGALVVRSIVLARRGALNRPKVAYALIALGLHAAIYFFVARFEPTYARSAGPDQDFLLIQVLTTIFHNVQYMGLVWFHNRNRYGEAPAHADLQADYGGVARFINRSLGHFALACLLFSVVYLLFACWTGVFAGCQLFLGARLGPFTANQIGLCLWWGLALNHYYLDQKIWRIRGDPALKRNLGLAPA